MSLSSLLDKMADSRCVFTRHGKNTGADITEHICEVSRVAQEAWSSLRGRSRALPVTEIRAALQRVDARTAAVRMADLASEDLVWHTKLRNPKATLEIARQVVRLLGSDTVWWTNRGEVTSKGQSRTPVAKSHSWSPVTDFTFDGVVAGVGGSRFVVVLQVGED